ncbi:hypothetical protein QE429_004484 [Bacillus sp. SORGH_AS 510]|uniref:DUF3221 domain-containing protein n=1 Tax=Bacillus sp. SORGH_AS_0510 TaxID=3041771 RepID=UPI0027871ECA|nr:DUF3221 domain-containing protein [Bacillus sp. SORGH_AS_0510]MDQ1147657.1 hypothetical protein [Bacillus sp. SORGH_AS_0510]
MKRIIFSFLLLISLCFTLLGCNVGDVEKGKVDLKGIITEVNRESNQILLKDKNVGFVWVTLPDHGDINKYEKGQEVVVWVKGGIRESSPAQADALNIEFANPNIK